MLSWSVAFLILVLAVVSYFIVVFGVVVYGIAFLIVVVFLILDFCLFSLIFPYRSLDRPFPYPYPCLGWRRGKNSFRLRLGLLDFCFFCVILPLILSRITPG